MSTEISAGDSNWTGVCSVTVHHYNYTLTNTRQISQVHREDNLCDVILTQDVASESSFKLIE